MNLLLPYDVETTGFPNWQKPSGDDSQPHIVQIAGLLINEDTREVIQSLDLIIKPDGWKISDEASAVHGITTEHAMDVGIPEHVALEAFLAMWGQGKAKRVAFNKTFDQRIIRIATKRYCNEDVIERWAEKDDHECSMRMARKVMGGKVPNLADAYKFFTGKELENAHTAMADAKACLEVYWGALAKIDLQPE